VIQDVEFDITTIHEEPTSLSVVLFLCALAVALLALSAWIGLKDGDSSTESVGDISNPRTVFNNDLFQADTSD
jgi:hypothetical protein